MRIYDTFLFNDELDMLECRLTELAGKVDRHVLVEAKLDHQGNPKPLHYAENAARFARWADSIVHVVADLPSREEAPDPWAREHAQRQAVWEGLVGAAGDDVVLVCDVDEIPGTRALRLRPGQPTALSMRLSMFAVDWVCPDETRIAVAGTVSQLRGTPLFVLRDNGVRAQMPVLEGAGWHFTWLGGPEAIRRKADQFCHLELRDMILAGNDAGEWYEQGYTWHGPGPYPPPRRLNRLIPVDVNRLWPVYIRNKMCPPEWFRPRVDRPAG